MRKNIQENGRIVVVSNRLPVKLKKTKGGWRSEESAGGLATAMKPVLQSTDGLWIGWSGETSSPDDAGRQKLINQWREQDRYVAVDLPPETAQGFYDGFSNQTLWFLFHNFPSLYKFDSENWRAYVEANRIFCDAVIRHVRPNDLIWIHDYQLMLLPQLIRERAPEARIGFFLHIPFPSSTVYRLLPRGDELLRGLLGADYIAFHTHRYLQHFRSSALRILGLSSSMDRVEYDNRTIRMEAQPIGIAPEEFTGLLNNKDTMARLTKMRDGFNGRKILLSVDRLDYTKGIPERLRAYRLLLRRFPELQDKVTFIQVAVPSRGKVQRYKDLQQDVDKLIGQINGEFSTAAWMPVVYLKRNLPRTELVALYALADVAWVSPLRDGFNLVAKEYVACKPDRNGVLVLSEFAGAAAEMGEALFVNPYDEERSAETIARALNLNPEERYQRMDALYRRVDHNNAFSWSKRFISNLRVSSSDRLRERSDAPSELPVSEIVKAFNEASNRLLLLDYDGTLVPYASRPQDAAPPDDLIELLQRLADDPSTLVALVSGRTRFDLEKWFGPIKGLWLAAEHGAILKSPHSSQWEDFHTNPSDDWKKQVYPVLEHFADRTPGSFIEEKEFSLVWHHRMSDAEFGEWLANELVETLERMLADTHLKALRGQKTVEIKPFWANKGEIFDKLIKLQPVPDFLLGAGDDITDEDLFARMPPDSWTIHIGDNSSRARYRLPDFREMRKLISRLQFAAETGKSHPRYRVAESL